MHNGQSATERELSVVPIAALGCAVVLTAVSLLFTPNSSGVPASFGNIFQPLVWLMAAACVALGLLVCVPLIIAAYLRTRRGLSPGTPNKVAVIISAIVLSVSVLQVLFALFGPDI
jgi:hypothetical protein